MFGIQQTGPETVVTVDLTQCLAPADRTPEFFTAHRVQAEVRSAGLRRQPFRATCSFSLRPKIAGDALFLSDLTPDQAPRLVSSFAHGGVIRDKAYSSDRITLGGVDFPKGLTTHPEKTGGKAYAELVYDLTGMPAKMTHFRALVGMQSGMAGSVAFAVSTRKGDGDWQQVFHTETMGQATPPANVDILLTGVTGLRLEVTDGGNGIGSDHAVWAMARFE